MVFGVVTSNGDVLPLFLFPHRLKLRDLHQGSGGDSTGLDREGGNATKVGEPSVG